MIDDLKNNKNVFNSVEANILKKDIYNNDEFHDNFYNARYYNKLDIRDIQMDRIPYTLFKDYSKWDTNYTKSEVSILNKTLSANVAPPLDVNNTHLDDFYFDGDDFKIFKVDNPKLENGFPTTDKGFLYVINRYKTKRINKLYGFGGHFPASGPSPIYHSEHYFKFTNKALGLSGRDVTELNRRQYIEVVEQDGDGNYITTTQLKTGSTFLSGRFYNFDDVFNPHERITEMSKTYNKPWLVDTDVVIQMYVTNKRTYIRSNVNETRLGKLIHHDNMMRYYTEDVTNATEPRKKNPLQKSDDDDAIVFDKDIKIKKNKFKPNWVHFLDEKGEYSIPKPLLVDRTFKKDVREIMKSNYHIPKGLIWTENGFYRDGVTSDADLLKNLDDYEKEYYNTSNIANQTKIVCYADGKNRKILEAMIESNSASSNGGKMEINFSDIEAFNEKNYWQKKRFRMAYVKDVFGLIDIPEKMVSMTSKATPPNNTLRDTTLNDMVLKHFLERTDEHPFGFPGINDLEKKEYYDYSKYIQYIGFRIWDTVIDDDIRLSTHSPVPNFEDFGSFYNNDKVDRSMMPSVREFNANSFHKLNNPSEIIQKRKKFVAISIKYKARLAVNPAKPMGPTLFFNLPYDQCSISDTNPAEPKERIYSFVIPKDIKKNNTDTGQYPILTDYHTCGEIIPSNNNILHIYDMSIQDVDGSELEFVERATGDFLTATGMKDGRVVFKNGEHYEKDVYGAPDDVALFTYLTSPEGSVNEGYDKADMRFTDKHIPTLRPLTFVGTYKYFNFINQLLPYSTSATKDFEMSLDKGIISGNSLNRLKPDVIIKKAEQIGLYLPEKNDAGDLLKEEFEGLVREAIYTKNIVADSSDEPPSIIPIPDMANYLKPGVTLDPSASYVLSIAYIYERDEQTMGHRMASAFVYKTPIDSTNISTALDTFCNIGRDASFAELHLFTKSVKWITLKKVPKKIIVNPTQYVSLPTIPEVLRQKPNFILEDDNIDKYLDIIMEDKNMKVDAEIITKGDDLTPMNVAKLSILEKIKQGYPLSSEASAKLGRTKRELDWTDWTAMFYPGSPKNKNQRDGWRHTLSSDNEIRDLINENNPDFGRSYFGEINAIRSKALPLTTPITVPNDYNISYLIEKENPVFGNADGGCHKFINDVHMNSTVILGGEKPAGSAFDEGKTQIFGFGVLDERCTMPKNNPDRFLYSRPFGRHLMLLTYTTNPTASNATMYQEIGGQSKLVLKSKEKPRIGKIGESNDYTKGKPIITTRDIRFTKLVDNDVNTMPKNTLGIHITNEPYQKITTPANWHEAQVRLVIYNGTSFDELPSVMVINSTSISTYIYHGYVIKVVGNTITISLDSSNSFTSNTKTILFKKIYWR